MRAMARRNSPRHRLPCQRALHVPARHRSLANDAPTMWPRAVVEVEANNGAPASTISEAGPLPPSSSLQRNTDPGAVFVVQGASRGIGLELVRLLLQRTVGTVVATCRSPIGTSAAGLRSLQQEQAEKQKQRGHPSRLHVIPLDLEQQGSAQLAAADIQSLGGGRVDALLNVAGMLHEGQPSTTQSTQSANLHVKCSDDGGGDISMPERSLSAVSAGWLARSLAVNCIGPLMFVQALAPMLRVRKTAARAPSVVVNISARVGSISDNRLGGWYSYRISKAALNQATRTMALELQRHNCWVPSLFNNHSNCVSQTLQKVWDLSYDSDYF